MSLLVGGNKCFVLALRPTSFAEETAFNIPVSPAFTRSFAARDTTLLQTCETSNGQQDHFVSGWRDIQNLEIQTCPICGLRFSFREYLNETATSSFFKGHFGTLPGDCWHGLPWQSMEFVHSNQWDLARYFFPKLRTYLSKLVHWWLSLLV